ncbi:hypothetical protein [Draconibacterium halophilum]|uniref:Uncharacterized protein n=1 Tax=Draconibacterium halophilum TaxID=2706887 RepID=A0A6C0RAG5_9BACT|nr:hypothetical protein [Draconibacterium halophilum]QIA06433.1 hypothetical protein G0Q07_01225 [Draconibacterium halophilum]
METNQIIEEQNITASKESATSFRTEFEQIVEDKNSGTIDTSTAISKMKQLRDNVNNSLFTEENIQLFSQLGLTLHKGHLFV